MDKRTVHSSTKGQQNVNSPRHARADYAVLANDPDAIDDRKNDLL
jgi:hypothetical protein